MGESVTVKNAYFSMGLGLVLAAAVAFGSYAQAPKKSKTPAGVTKEVPGGYTDAEKLLLDRTLGGAIAPQNDEGLDDPNGYAGALSDRIANDGGFDSVDQKSGRKMSAPKQRQQPAGMRRDVVKLFNPYAPVKLPQTNKISFGSAPKITYIPGFGPDVPALTADDIKILASLAANKITFNRLTPKMEQEYGLPIGTSEAINRVRSPRLDGMLPSEFAVKSTVDSIMSLVESREGESRKKAAAAAYQRLSVMADGFRQLNSVPKEIYTAMGTGDAYMKDTKEGYTNGLGRLQEAMEALDKIKRGDEDR
jgi:hypothetical protein